MPWIGSPRWDGRGVSRRVSEGQGNYRRWAPVAKWNEQHILAIMVFGR
jgi:hypothetical protein